MNIEVWKIDKNEPMPVPTRARNGWGNLPPITQLDIGDSIEFPVKIRNRVQVRASQLKRLDGKEFTVRVVADGVCRIWRTK
jgi:hypothetical protein